MIAILYRWRIVAGQEAAFAEAWRTITEALYAHGGSLGSSLHLAADGTYVAYARWPSLQARTAGFAAELPGTTAARQTMKDAIAEAWPEQPLTVVCDALRATRSPVGQV